jgi:hypothetical protein
MAVVAAAHVLFEVVLLQDIAPVVAAEPIALIRMNYDEGVPYPDFLQGTR